MTVELFREEFAKFDWPDSYIIEADEPFDITVKFPRCTLIFWEYPDEGDVWVTFSPGETKTKYSLGLEDAMLAIVPLDTRGHEPMTPGLT
ncbi:MAG TPA: hypothetical protein VHS96_11280, partial [Bacteroidia bacterium]|nr:hypothetical protein [Bacteroidia bacterium]